MSEKMPSHISVPPSSWNPNRPKHQNGKGDGRGKKISILSDQGRANWDEIFRKKDKK